MSHDPYSPCVCGSGKKLKFCCQDILSEMIRVEKLIENQPAAAEKLLRSLLAKHADKEVLVTQLSAVLRRQGNFTEAREILVGFLKRQPDEPRALLALADLCLVSEGFWSSRRIVHRGFQLGVRQYPHSVAMLATRIANQMAQVGCAMAVREHLALAIRLSEGEHRNSLMMQLANFESQRNIPYPFRGRIDLLPVKLEDGLQQSEELRARKVARIGCWEPAAILCARLLEQVPNNGELWHNLGLFRAWDGQLKEAASALHKAAELIEDYDLATESEALAQLLDLDLAEDGYGIVQHTVPVGSLSELLTILDGDERFARVQHNKEETTDDGRRIAAEYEFLSSPLPDAPTPDNLPDVISDITIVDVEDDSESEPQALIVALDSDADAALQAFRDAAGDLATADEKETDEDADEGVEPTQLSRMPATCRLFDWKIHHSDALGNSDYRNIDQKRLENALEQWLRTPLASLGGVSPEEAAKNEVNRVKVGASVLTLDVTCNRMGYDPDLADIRSKLGIPAPAPLDLPEDMSVTAVPLLRFFRLQPESLTDDQVVEYTNRVSLVRHMFLLERGIEELIKRPGAVETVTPMRAHLVRASVARENNDLHLASECYAAARDSVSDDPDAFRTKLELDIRELSCRLDDPKDPELPAMLSAIREKYFVKIPEIEEVIREELTNSGCLHLLEQLPTAAPAAESSGGLWTPDADKPAESGEKSKLWIPGQD